MRRSKTLRLAMLLAFVAGCTDMTDSGQTTGADEPPAGSAAFDPAEIQDALDTFTRSLMERDVNALAEIVSDEIVARGVERGISLQAFLEKERASLLRTLDLTEGDDPALEVAELFPAGDRAVRVALRSRGEPLRKDLYFVREGGSLKLNLAKPGFSKLLRSRSNYQVHNTNFGLDPVTMMCDPNNVSLSAGQTKSVSCNDSCGFWSGTLFQRFLGTAQKRCDWNTWGDDVIINILYFDGWDCNDYC